MRRIRDWLTADTAGVGPGRVTLESLSLGFCISTRKKYICVCVPMGVHTCG